MAQAALDDIRKRPAPPLNPYAAPADQRGAAPDFLSGLRSVTDPLGGVVGNVGDALEMFFTDPKSRQRTTAFGKPLAPSAEGEMAGQTLLELTGLPSLLRARRANIEGKTPTTEDLIGAAPGIGFAAGAVRTGSRASKVGSLLDDIPLDAEQIAARIGAKSPAQREFAQSLAREVAEREAAGPRPGYTRLYRAETAEGLGPDAQFAAERLADQGVSRGARYFTSDPNVAEAYRRGLDTGKSVFAGDTPGRGRVSYVDVPSHEVGRFRPVNPEMADEFVLPKDWADKRRPLVASGPRVEAPKPAKPDDLGFNPTKYKDLDPDIQMTLLDTATRNAGFLAQRRGTLSIAEITKELAPKTGLTHEQILKSKVGQAFNAEELWSLNQTMVDASQRVNELRKIVSGGGDTTANKMKLIASMAEQAELQRVFSGARSETGRALRVLRETAKNADTSPTAYDRALEAIGGRANADKIIARLDDIWADPKIPDAEKTLWTYKFTRQLGEASKLDKVTEAWINSILSSPITQEVNAISNAAFAAVQPPTRFLTAAAEAVTTVGGRTRPREVFFGDAAYGTFGMLKGIGPGIRKGLYILRNGFNPEDVAKFRETGSLGRTQALEGPIGNLVNVPLRVLGAVDAIFKSMGYTSEVYAQAARSAAKKGQRFGSAEWAKETSRLVNDPTADILKAAGDYSEYITFQSRSGALTSGLLKLRNEAPALRFVIPFITTPTNLVKRGLEYSPLGIIQAAKSSGAARSEAVARATIGSAILGYFATNFLGDGKMTGSAPTDPAQRDAFYRSGKMPYAVKIGDSWVEYRRIEPLATPLTWMAAIYDAFNSDPEADLTESAGRAVASMSRSVLDATYLDGIADFIDAIEDPERYGGNWLARLASGLLPFSGLTRGIAQADDPIIRKPEGIGEQVKANLPGYSQDVPPRVDVFGQPLERPESRQGLGALFNPLRVSPATQDLVDQNLSQLSIPQGPDENGKQRPAKPVTIGFTGSEISGLGLSREEAARYQEIAGEATYNSLQALFQTPEYLGLTIAERVEVVQKTVADARRAGRVALATEIVATSITPEMVTRATQMGLGAATTNIAKGNFLSTVQNAGKLQPEVIAAVDAQQDADELKVADYLHGKELVDAWRNVPPFLLGNQQVWDQAKRARDQLVELRKGKTADEIKRDQNIQTLYATGAAGWLRTLYESDGSRKSRYVHPTRLLIAQDRIWKSFDDAVRNEP